MMRIIKRCMEVCSVRGAIEMYAEEFVNPASIPSPSRLPLATLSLLKGEESVFSPRLLLGVR